MYQALYRKYRPKNFDEVVGQEHITSVLKQEIASGRIGHAYLFTGSRGTGKTSCSKIIAKAVNCPHQQDGNPCGVCDICRGIDDGSILDVTEIDAASNNGVDNIRQLREEANFTPAVTNYRVYIIDETHMLSTGAFNALLKIMEEPPEHVIFILATTEVHKIPATILPAGKYRHPTAGCRADWTACRRRNARCTFSAGCLPQQLGANHRRAGAAKRRACRFRFAVCHRRCRFGAGHPCCVAGD